MKHVQKHSNAKAATVFVKTSVCISSDQWGKEAVQRELSSSFFQDFLLFFSFSCELNALWPDTELQDVLSILSPLTSPYKWRMKYLCGRSHLKWGCDEYRIYVEVLHSQVDWNFPLHKCISQMTDDDNTSSWQSSLCDIKRPLTLITFILKPSTDTVSH